MFQKHFFLIMAAIAVLVGATSCDKDFLTDEDRFIKTQMKYFKFAGENTITIYERKGGNLYEIEQREVNFTLTPALVLFPLKYITEPLTFAEGETGIREIPFGKMYNDSIDFTEANNVELTFKFNAFEQSINFSGYNLNQDSIFLYPLDDFILTAELKNLKQIDVPFYQKVQITYRLVTDSEIVVTKTTQELNLGTKPEDEDSSTPSDETNNNGGESGDDNASGKGEGTNV